MKYIQRFIYFPSRVIQNSPLFWSDLYLTRPLPNRGKEKDEMASNPGRGNFPKKDGVSDRASLSYGPFTLAIVVAISNLSCKLLAIPRRFESLVVYTPRLSNLKGPLGSLRHSVNRYQSEPVRRAHLPGSQSKRSRSRSLGFDKGQESKTFNIWTINSVCCVNRT